MPDKWKLKKSDITGGNDKTFLDGAEIRVSSDGKAYEFVVVAAKTTGNALPEAPFTFPGFSFADHDWDIAVNSIGANSPAIGTWSNDDISAGENGDFTAQAGPGVEDEAGDASAASA